MFKFISFNENIDARQEKEKTKREGNKMAEIKINTKEKKKVKD